LSYRAKQRRMADTDEELGWVRASQSGDPTAFARLVSRHQRMIHALAYRMTGSLAEAEDLAQETFIAAWDQLGGFRGEASFSSWLYRIALNRCLNFRARATRREAVHRQWSEQRETHAPGDAQVSQQVQEALLKLDPAQRAAVVLTVYDGLNHAEAARALGCAETTVSWRVFMARRKLKQLLAGVRGGGA
jgi:RNA polymerase sigma-70 factor (ECF subfamily)